MIEIYIYFTLWFTKNTTRKGCFFHLSESIYRQVQSLSLSSAYIDNMMVPSTIRQMMAPALVPEKYVTSLCSNLGQELDGFECNELSGIFKYFNDHWMNPIPM